MLDMLDAFVTVIAKLTKLIKLTNLCLSGEVVRQTIKLHCTEPWKPGALSAVGA